VKKRICLLALVAMIGGCATVGTKISMDKIQQIEKGVTTKQGVIDLLGKPCMVSLSAEGKTIRMYHYVKATNKVSSFIAVVNLMAGGMDMNQQIVQVLLDENDIVEKYIFNDTETEINTGLLNRN